MALNTCQVMWRDSEKLFSSLISDPSASDHSTLVSTLVSRVTGAFHEDADKENYENVCYGACMGMLNVAYRRPEHIDLLLRQYFAVTHQVDATGEIPEGLCYDLLWCLNMNVVEFRNNAFATHDQQYICAMKPGRDDPVDNSIVNMTQQEVEQRFEVVRDVLNKHMTREKEVLVQQAVCGRYAAMTYTGVCQQLPKSAGKIHLCDAGIEETLVEGGKLDGWDKVRFVGTLLRVRAMAKSLFERPVEELCLSKEDWLKWLKRWLWDPELNPTNDQMVKQHVLVSAFQRPYNGAGLLTKQ